MIGAASQGGLGLPDRDYYTKDDDKSKQIREQYVQHVSKMLQLAGDSLQCGGRRSEETVMAVETQMALADVQDARGAARSGRQLPQDDTDRSWATLTPDFSWPSYFQEIGFPDIREVDVGQPEFFQALDKDLTSVSLADWRTLPPLANLDSLGGASAAIEVPSMRILTSTTAR